MKYRSLDSIRPNHWIWLTAEAITIRKCSYSWNMWQVWKINRKIVNIISGKSNQIWIFCKINRKSTQDLTYWSKARKIQVNDFIFKKSTNETNEKTLTFRIRKILWSFKFLSSSIGRFEIFKKIKQLYYHDYQKLFIHS